MIMAENQWGLKLLDFIQINEQEIMESDSYKPITGSLILVKCEEKYLVAYNKWRKQWEIPAGGIEKGETPRECVERELFEETNQKVENIEFMGLFKLYDTNKDITKYQAMYFSHMNELSSFEENDEMDKIMLWDLKTYIGEFDTVDRKMIDLCLKRN